MLRAIILLLVFSIGPALAAFPETMPAGRLAEIKAMIENDQPDQALQALDTLAVDQPANADVLNLMGYAYRKLGRFAESRKRYEHALALDPRHKGALEYMAELELQTGNQAAARNLLARLREACPTGCEELDDLLAAFAKHGLKTKN